MPTPRALIFLFILSILSIGMILQIILNNSIQSYSLLLPPSNINISTSISINKTIEIKDIIKERITTPSQCKNSSHKNLLNIFPTKNNWTPYYLRCNFKYFNKTSNMIVGELFFSKELNYIHLYKAGGTTIQTGLDKLQMDKKLKITKYKESRQSNIYFGAGKDGIHRNVFNNFISNNSIIFTFIRDPLNKFLSGFFEANKRRNIQRNKNVKVNKNGKAYDLLREWISNILKSREERRILIDNVPITNKWMDFHLLSNLKMMEGAYEWFNYIGNLDNLNNDLPQIISRFVINDTFFDGIGNYSAFMDKYFNHKRDRNGRNYVNKIVDKFNFKISDLSDKDISDICEIYWLDYICFPFDIPKQCNLTLLLIKHYGKHVEYKSCY